MSKCADVYMLLSVSWEQIIFELFQYSKQRCL